MKEALASLHILLESDSYPHELPWQLVLYDCVILDAHQAAGQASLMLPLRPTDIASVLTDFISMHISAPSSSILPSRACAYTFCSCSASCMQVQHLRSLIFELGALSGLEVLSLVSELCMGLEPRSHSLQATCYQL